jgi:hypothetical protein
MILLLAKKDPMISHPIFHQLKGTNVINAVRRGIPLRTSNVAKDLILLVVKWNFPMTALVYSFFINQNDIPITFSDLKCNKDLSDAFLEHDQLLNDHTVS